MKEYKMLIVGAGGIGSYFCRELSRLQNAKQVVKLESITVADPDAVDVKNVTYQDYSKEEELLSKAVLMEERYGFTGLETKIIEESQLANYDIIVCCVDNAVFRKLLFEYCAKKPDVYFIDLRSEGTTISAFTTHKKNTLDKLLGTISLNDKESRSCQRDYELQAGIIQQGNKIIAPIGTQFLLNYLRSDPNPPQYSYNF